MTTTYRDLINADGSFNRAAIMRVAASRARHERNLAIVVDNGAKIPERTLYRDVRPAYAALAATLPRPASVKPWSVFFARELRDVWTIARGMKANFVPAAHPVAAIEYAEAA